MKESSTEAAAAADMAPDDDEQGSISDTNWLVEPFPTIYWLTHPTLHAAIAELERDGYGVHYEQRLAADTVALDCMRRAHTTYGKKRWLLLSSTDQAYIQRRNWHESAFSTQRGVAGSTNPNAVKCLHAHTAHYLSGCTDNVIGQWAMEAVNDKKQKKQAERRED
jgi:uncharacterized protein